MADPTGEQMGDGDLFDADVHGLDDADLAPGAPTTGAAAPGDVDLGDERSSEIDDNTAATVRPTGDVDGGPTDGALTDGDGNDIDVSDIDVLALLAERDEYKALAQSIQAEFQNFKRVAAERARADADRATGRLAESLLPVLDAAESAYLNHPAEVGPLLNQMLVELKKQGLAAMDLDGQSFDPEVAEAVAHEPAGGGEPVVAEVLRSGYTWKGKTLRAAMVRTKD